MSSLEMEYDVIFQVMDSWEALRRIQDYEGVAGAILFEQYVPFAPPSLTHHVSMADLRFRSPLLQFV